MIKISIIMPVYNKEFYLRNTIEAILNQDYENFKLIIVNDGSTDSSKNICDEYARKDSRVRVYHIENGGVSNARNIGIGYATGDYIQFIDGDDCINEGVFNEYISILNKEEYDIIFSPYNKVDHGGNILKTVDLNYSGCTNKEKILDEFVKNQVDTGYYGWISNKLIRLDIIKKHNLKFDEKITLAEDLDFFLDVYKYSDKYYFSNKISFNYLQEAQNSSILLYDNLDYYIQLLINLKMKDFIIQSGYYKGENKNILDYRIVDYIFYIVFYTKLDKSNIKNKVKKLYENKNIMNSIQVKLTLSFKNIVIRFIRKNRYKLVYNCLYIRKLIRDIVRFIVPREE